MNDNRLVIGTRESVLALRQTEIAAKKLKEAQPGLEIRFETFRTVGDRILEKPLQEFGGKGVFVTELEQAILEGRMDLAVHSAKDMPMELEEGLEIVGVLEREDPRDVLVTVKGRKMPSNLIRIGTSSPRRKLQIEGMAPFAGRVSCQTLRGNVPTRLKKLEEGRYDGIILAAAGLKRLGLLDSPKYSFRFLDGGEFIPAGGQGILAIEGRPGSRAAKLCEAISHEESWRCLLAEREVLRLLEAGCHEPIGVYCQAAGKELLIQGISRRDGRVLRACLKGKMGEEMELAARLAAKLYG